MRKIIFHRLLWLIPVMLGVTFLTFALMHLAGSDAVERLYERNGAAVSEEVMEKAREKAGLDQPFPLQYLSWLKRLLRLDFGVSLISGEPVLTTFLEKLPATLLLTLTSTLFTILLSLPLGILAALHKDGPIDYGIRFLSFAGNALPNFFTALLLILFFCIHLGLLPVISEGQGLRPVLLPTLTLGLSMAAKYTRQVRGAVLEELGRGYVWGARARGIKERVIVLGSVLRCAMLSLVTLLSLSVGSLLGGTAIVESIFVWDGVGKLAVDAVMMRDYPLIQAYVVWMALIYLLVSLAGDLLLGFLDPRIRLGGGADG